LISTKNIDLEKLSSLKKSNKKTEGEDKASVIVFIPTRTIKIDQAITNTIDGIPGCVALLDGVVYSKVWWIPYIYGEQKIVIEATPLIDPTIKSTTTSFIEFGKVILDKNGEIKLFYSISKDEFESEKNQIIADGAEIKTIHNNIYSK
jgi:hypothetical protein